MRVLCPSYPCLPDWGHYRKKSSTTHQRFILWAWSMIRGPQTGFATVIQCRGWGICPAPCCLSDLTLPSHFLLFLLHPWLLCSFYLTPSWEWSIWKSTKQRASFYGTLASGSGKVQPCSDCFGSGGEACECGPPCPPST